MDIVEGRALQKFNSDVGTRFQLYNSLFTALPFHKIEKTGILLSLFSSYCEEGYKLGKSPMEIVDEFCAKHTSYTAINEVMGLLFHFVQYIERQVVLFDALEDASYKNLHDIDGVGSLKQLMGDITRHHKEEALKDTLKHFCVRLVLTAHPTQFYPGAVLGIINDLSKALNKNDTAEVNQLLQQLGKTPFLKKQKPTPYDEAMSLIWYLEKVFYPAAGRIMNTIKNQFPHMVTREHPILQMGFWPGGDRDGNPFVNCDITLKVADELRGAILKCYYLDVRRLKRRLTFAGVEQPLASLEKRIYDNLFIPGYNTDISAGDIYNTLSEIKQIIKEKHNGLFAGHVQTLLNKITVFGLYFATLDIRQESTVHENMYEAFAGMGLLPATYPTLDEAGKINLLLHIQPHAAELEDAVQQDTLNIPDTIKKIQAYNGEKGCNRYIISQCNSARNVIEVFSLFKLRGYKEEDITVDIVPLFETITDLENAPYIMQQLYMLPAYKAHLERRGGVQTIMLGFSDGTKDGGYLTANWGIYKAKEELTAITRRYGYEVIFFDGRGGPPSRGGGKTHKFYASLGNNISSKEIQLTIQGQTVSSNFGIIDAAQFNIEQLLNAGISNLIFTNRNAALSGKEEQLLQELSSYGLDAYKVLKGHPHLADYLYEVSPLRYYSETNIGSRPAKRGKSTAPTLKDLRAIPFAGSWSQIKQNVPGFFGVGTALQKMEYIGKWEEVKSLYHHSLYLKTLLDNCEMAMSKSYFPITSYLAKDEKFAGIYSLIYNEFLLTKEYLLKLTGKKTIMGNYPVDKLSIRMRERIVLPLVTIQQYAISKIREMGGEDDAAQALKETLGKLIMRCSFGIINAGRNSA